MTDTLTLPHAQVDRLILAGSAQDSQLQSVLTTAVLLQELGWQLMETKRTRQQHAWSRLQRNLARCAGCHARSSRSVLQLSFDTTYNTMQYNKPALLALPRLPCRTLDDLYMICEADWHADLVDSAVQYLEQSVHDFKQVCATFPPSP